MNINTLKIVEREILRKLPALTHLDLGENLISHIHADKTFAEVSSFVIIELFFSTESGAAAILRLLWERWD